jgi:hypothetical protein
MVVYLEVRRSCTTHLTWNQGNKLTVRYDMSELLLFLTTVCLTNFDNFDLFCTMHLQF